MTKYRIIQHAINMDYTLQQEKTDILTGKIWIDIKTCCDLKPLLIILSDLKDIYIDKVIYECEV